jgi:hypothetical protein
MEKKNDDILSCWKEIADYLDRSVRTCQRWVKIRGLPVSYPGGTKSSPYASKAALDLWRMGGAEGRTRGSDC